MRSISDFVGATFGTIPPSRLDGSGISTSTFLRNDGTFAVPDYPVASNPTASVGPTATNGVATTFMRSDAAPALNLTVAYTFTNTVTAATLVSSGSITATTGFGCNGKTAQTAATVNAAISATAGAAYTATEQGMLNDLKALVNQIRTALVNDGIAV
jgi:hypothetical protein